MPSSLLVFARFGAPARVDFLFARTLPGRKSRHERAESREKFGVQVGGLLWWELRRFISILCSSKPRLLHMNDKTTSRAQWHWKKGHPLFVILKGKQAQQKERQVLQGNWSTNACAQSNNIPNPTLHFLLPFLSLHSSSGAASHG